MKLVIAIFLGAVLITPNGFSAEANSKKKPYESIIRQYFRSKDIFHGELISDEKVEEENQGAFNGHLRRQVFRVNQVIKGHLRTGDNVTLYGRGNNAKPKGEQGWYSTSPLTGSKRLGASALRVIGYTNGNPEEKPAQIKAYEYASKGNTEEEIRARFEKHFDKIYKDLVKKCRATIGKSDRESCEQEIERWK